MTLELQVNDIYGTVLWSTGESNYKIVIPSLNNSLTVTSVFTSQCGRQIVFTYQLNVILSSNNNVGE